MINKIRVDKPRPYDDPEWTGWGEFHQRENKPVTNSHEHIQAFAQRIRRGHTFTLGAGMIALVKAHRADTEVFKDCELIMRAYPMQFPLTAEKAAD